MIPQPTNEQKIEAAYEYLERACQVRKRVLKRVDGEQAEQLQDRFEAGIVKFAQALINQDPAQLERAAYETYIAYRQVEWDEGKNIPLLTIEKHQAVFVPANPSPEQSFESLVAEGQALAKAFKEQTQPMRVITAEDLKRISR